MKKWNVAMGVLLGSMMLNAAPVGATLADWDEPGTRLTLTDGVFRLTGATVLRGKEILPVDRTRKYRLSGEFRKVGDEPSSELLFGFDALDENRRSIMPQHVIAKTETATELTRPLGAGDRTIYVRNGGKLVAHRFNFVAFDGNAALTDLPNFNLAGPIVAVKELKPDEWEVKLSRPLGEARAVGTSVRMHCDGPNYIYTGARGTKLDHTWQRFSGVIDGELLGKVHSNKFRPGTANLRLIIVPDYKSRQTGIEFRNLQFEEVL